MVDTREKISAPSQDPYPCKISHRDHPFKSCTMNLMRLMHSKHSLTLKEFGVSIISCLYWYSAAVAADILCLSGVAG